MQTLFPNNIHIMPIFWWRISQLSIGVTPLIDFILAIQKNSVPFEGCRLLRSYSQVAYFDNIHHITVYLTIQCFPVFSQHTIICLMYVIVLFKRGRYLFYAVIDSTLQKRIHFRMLHSTCNKYETVIFWTCLTQNGRHSSVFFPQYNKRNTQC